MEIQGKYAKALVTTDDIDEASIAQIYNLVNSKAAEGSNIVIMPDVHAGAGSVIGLTMTINDRVVPNLVGVDGGCGLLAIKFEGTIDLDKLQAFIEKEIPVGFGINSLPKKDISPLIDYLYTPLTASQVERINKSVGTLGGGNHFLSIETDDTSNYLVIHSGSRGLGLIVAEHYQKGAAALHPEEPEALAYLDGQDKDHYLHDLYIVQRYAELNRHTMANAILNGMGWTKLKEIETVHNYVVNGILRKGAVAGSTMFLVPLNMRDGTLICAGAFVPEWNYSAPHGAGRKLSRSQAKQELNFDDYKQQMEGIYSKTVTESNLDEAPLAYKDAEEIKEIISEKYQILKHLKPIYNYKST